MKFLKNLIKKQNVMQRVIGLNLAQLNSLTKRLEPLWKKADLKRKLTNKRKRNIGGGRPYKHEFLEQKIIIVLMYYKTYMTQEFLGLIAELDQSNISRLLKKILPLIEQAADPELAVFLAQAKKEYLQKSACQRVNDWFAFLEKYPELKEIATDATEQKCFRSLDQNKQKKHYSGKKKQHSLKTQISVSSTGRILDVSDTYPGSVHDKSIIDQEKTVLKFPKKTAQRFDSGYQGIVRQNPKYYLMSPVKKPKNGKLTSLEKEFNQMNSRRRVIAEHAFSRIKKFKIFGHLYRGTTKIYNQIFRTIVALINFKLANPAVV